MLSIIIFSFFFFNDTATTEIYTLSLHDALPISCSDCVLRIGTAGFDASGAKRRSGRGGVGKGRGVNPMRFSRRSEEHTSELQSQSNLVCRLLLEKKKKQRS